MYIYMLPCYLPFFNLTTHLQHLPMFIHVRPLSNVYVAWSDGRIDPIQSGDRKHLAI